MQKIIQYLKEVVERGGSDLHISVDSPPIIRLHGDLVHLERTPLSSEDTEILLGDLLSDSQMEELKRYKNLDFAYEVPHAGYTQRFRCNFFFQRKGLDGVFRVIPRDIPSMKELNLPDTVEDMARYRDGLVIITGPTGSGKSTTISTLIDIINRTQFRHIITLEDPIEYVHSNKQSIIHQRQINLHTRSFNRALKSALREDPDVIVVGEMRDLRTIDLALTAASTGHLVFTTMHTPSAPKAIERLIEFYPPQRQMSVRILLADCVRAVIAQQLIQRADGWGRVPAVEVMINCLPIANLIREVKGHQIVSVMQASKNIGMVFMDDYLMKLHKEGKITAAAAHEHAIDKKRLESILRSDGR